MIESEAEQSEWNLSDFKNFKGKLTHGVNSCEANFCARLDDKGEVEIALDEMPINDRTTFVLSEFDSKGPRFSKFILNGVAADDETRFETDDLYLIGIRTGSSTSRLPYMVLTPRCSTGRFTWRSSKHFEAPILAVTLKGFFNFGTLVAKTELGILEMIGVTESSAPDLLTGRLTLAANNLPEDMADWREKGSELIEHVRRIMSFSSASILRAPIHLLYFNDAIEVTYLSQTEQRSASLRVFHHLDQGPIFAAAVASYFRPVLRVKNLFFAIDWFAMEASYNEVRLINAMTALEMLVHSNLDETETLIQSSREFKKTRKAIKASMQASFDDQRSDAAKSSWFEMSEKLAELNRRSFYQKLLLLARKWNVPLTGLDAKAIKSAISARNAIVHRGQYYGPLPPADKLWHHVTIVREIVVRFLLTAIEFKGRYFSYVGGINQRDFPPVP